MIGEKLKNSTESITGGIKKLGKRNLVICASVFIIAVAICLNWALYSGIQVPDDTAPPVDNVIDGESTETGGETDVNDSAASYFASVQISRQQARDEALAVLQTVLENEDALEETKTQALSDISRIALEIEKEANIESLIRARGFEDCIAVLSGDAASIIVKSDTELLQNHVAQISEIVYEQSGVLPANVKIICK